MMMVIVLVGSRMVMMVVVLSVELTCVEDLVRMRSWMGLWGRTRFA